VRDHPIVVVALFFVACAATQPATDPDPSSGDPRVSDYTRLLPGSVRTYAVKYPGQDGELTVRVEGEQDGWIVDDRGGRFRVTSEGLRDPQRYLIKAPLEEGATWTAILSASAVEHYRVLQVGAPCEVRAGRFDDCLIIESRVRRDPRMQLRAEWTWIRDVGLGRVETTALIDGRSVPQTAQTLVHYDLHPGRPTERAPTGTGAADRAPSARQESSWGR